MSYFFVDNQKRVLVIINTFLASSCSLFAFIYAKCVIGIIRAAVKAVKFGEDDWSAVAMVTGQRPPLQVCHLRVSCSQVDF